MAARSPKIQIAFRYRTVDSASGVTRATAKRLAAHLGVDETQAIHQAPGIWPPSSCRSTRRTTDHCRPRR